jgi:hypothetical protein
VIGCVRGDCVRCAALRGTWLQAPALRQGPRPPLAAQTSAADAQLNPPHPSVHSHW